MQLLIRLGYLTEEGLVKTSACSARKVALCLTGIPSELMTELL